MLKSFNEIEQKLVQIPSKVVAIPGAETPSAIKAACIAKRKQIADFILIGNKIKIEELIKKEDKSLVGEFDIYHENDSEQSTARAIQIIRNHHADLILKGHITTAELMKAILNKNNGIEIDDILSDVLVFENAQSLTLMTDGGIVLYPDLNDKIALIKNAVYVAKKLDFKNPKVALLAAIEKANPKMQSTMDAAKISEMNQKGLLSDCIIDGPFALDIAVSDFAAKIKQIESPVAGNADILIMPNIEAGNIFGKALTYFAHFKVGHVIMGAKVPILVTSRADDAQTKLNSIALGLICA